MDSVPRLETDRLKLRAVFPEDAADVFELFSDPLVAQYYEFEPFQSIDQAVALIRKFTHWFQNNQAIRWGMIDRTSGKLIGSCCFDTFRPKYHSVNLGYNLRSDRWGAGLATEAVSAIIDVAFQQGIVGPVNRIQAMSVTENVASERVVRRLGFHHEGLMRQFGFWKSQYHDMNLFSLLKQDWQGAIDARHSN